MKASQLLGVFSTAVPKLASSRRGFLLFRSFTRTMGFYQGLLTLAFVVLIALLFNHFLVTFQEVTLVVTEADEELIAMLDAFVLDGLAWLLALVCVYTVCTTLLSVQGARYLQEQAQSASTEHSSE